MACGGLWRMTGPEFVMRMNDDYLYRSPDGREAWILFGTQQPLVFIATDIYGRGQPDNAVGFSANTLRKIADLLDERNGLATGDL